MFIFLFYLLNEPRFRPVDKIKTIGSTYMGAVGLMLEYKIQAVSWFVLIFLFYLLNEPRFRPVDKIKTIGSTYMGAVGLMPEYKIQAVSWLV